VTPKNSLGTGLPLYRSTGESTDYSIAKTGTAKRRTVSKCIGIRYPWEPVHRLEATVFPRSWPDYAPSMTSPSSNPLTKPRTLGLVLSSIFVALGLAYGGSLIGAGLAAKAGNAITVTGSAKTLATADTVVWNLTVSESGQSAANAVKKVESGSTALHKYLTDGSLPAEGIEVGGISSYPNNEYVNGNPTGRVLSYNASQTTIVRSKDVQLIKKLTNGIGSLLQTGVNVQNNGPQYLVSTLASLRPQLLADAMKDAKARAQSITAAVGGKVGAVLSVTSGPVQVTTQDSTDASGGGFYDTTTIPKTVSVTVSVSFKVSK